MTAGREAFSTVSSELTSPEMAANTKFQIGFGWNVNFDIAVVRN